MAAANLGSLVATVAANTKPFQSGMKRANGMLSQLGQKLGITDRQLKIMAKTAAAAAAAFLAFKKVASMLEETAQRIDDLAKRARALGADVNQVAQLTFASALAGGDEQRFFSTMGRLMLNIGQGSETTRLALKTLGLELEDLANKTPIDAFLVLQDAIGNVENQAERMGIIALIAGGRMENMIPLMNLLGQDVQGFMDEFSELHGVIDAEQWEDYIDELTRLRTAWNGLKMTLLLDVLPAFKSIIKSVKEIVASFRRWWPLVRNLAIALSSVAAAIVTLRIAKIAIMRILPIFAKMIRAITILQFSQAIAAASASMNFANYAKIVAAATVATAGAILAFKEMDEATKQLNEITGGEDKGNFEDLLQKARDLEGLIGKAQGWLQNLRTPEEIFADTLNELALIKAKFEELGLTAQQAQLIWNRGVASALKTLLESKKVMDSIRQAGSLKLGTMAEASGRMAAERQQQRQTEYLNQLNQAMAVANDILDDIRNKIEPPPGNVPALP
tara:strand:- start:3533 stop:5047 length:1515 start_codon:yes stop_codon:yes gene_type:complete